jgi:hypothetical protein
MRRKVTRSTDELPLPAVMTIVKCVVKTGTVPQGSVSTNTTGKTEGEMAAATDGLGVNEPIASKLPEPPSPHETSISVATKNVIIFTVHLVLLLVDATF